jgi:hypothetical protein
MPAVQVVFSWLSFVLVADVETPKVQVHMCFTAADVALLLTLLMFGCLAADHHVVC